jgi:hypothetical protein
VENGVGTNAPEDVLGGALADVDLVHLDAGRRITERSPVDANDVVTELDEALGEHLSEATADAGNEDLHDDAPAVTSGGSPRRRLRPVSMRQEMRSFTFSTWP